MYYQQKSDLHQIVLVNEKTVIMLKEFNAN